MLLPATLGSMLGCHAKVTLTFANAENRIAAANQPIRIEMRVARPARLKAAVVKPFVTRIR
jgi:hypothetical protein